MNEEILFRQAEEDDLLPLARLRWEAREGDGERPAVGREGFLRACVAFLGEGRKRGEQVSFVALLAGRPIAHLAIQRIRLFPRPAKVNDQMGIITENYTRLAYRNRGVGGRLLRRGIEWAKAQDFELLLVYPSERAVPFYERAGFRGGSDLMELQLREYYSPEWSER